MVLKMQEVKQLSSYEWISLLKQVLRNILSLNFHILSTAKLKSFQLLILHFFHLTISQTINIFIYLIIVILFLFNKNL
jgi:hypothetical protein